jgi:hypothetical protein
MFILGCRQTKITKQYSAIKTILAGCNRPKTL